MSTPSMMGAGQGCAKCGEPIFRSINGVGGMAMQGGKLYHPECRPRPLSERLMAWRIAWKMGPRYWLWYSWAYRPVMAFQHRRGWHHTKTIGPVDGSILVRCDWCGLGQWQRVAQGPDNDCQQSANFSIGSGE